MVHLRGTLRKNRDLQTLKYLEFRIFKSTWRRFQKKFKCQICFPMKFRGMTRFVEDSKGTEKAKWKMRKTYNSLKPTGLYPALPVPLFHVSPPSRALFFLPLTCCPFLLADQKLVKRGQVPMAEVNLGLILNWEASPKISQSLHKIEVYRETEYSRSV